ncbi:5-dehydro-4-deoxy-D-glucuronate isomerase [Prosthecomicrobium sp. N25]|uniref:5-dehydro-4-deoxy-D-glucuronate isomerase n=1 Tax=Prosthecomicrobium sp. N25 TaxID=3129254 RepID=UPI0030776A18
MDIRYSTHAGDYPSYDTATLRARYLVEGMFQPDQIRMTYCHDDRMVLAGLCPVSRPLVPEGGKMFGGLGFFDRREAGVFAIEGRGTVTAGGRVYELAPGDCVYLGMGSGEVSFASLDPASPAKFYLVSVPAHRALPSRLIRRADARLLELGSVKDANRRQLRQYLHPDVIETCQLCMGLTELQEGSVWNTYPCHTHERRMEAYLYFGLGADGRVFHCMGRPDETRHLVVANEQAVISPSWSVHMGAGTRNYAFIWAMAGENQEFTDMDMVAPQDLR